MNKIRSITQLKARQKRLEQRKEELEKAIHYDWLDVKESIKPKNIASQLFARIFDKEPKDKNSLANTLSELAAVFTKIAVKKAEAKVTRWMSNKK
jgi:hypothetical protein